MQHTARTRTTADDLQTIVDHWQHMRALVDTSQTSDTWPPTMGRTEYMRALDDHDRDETALLLQHAQHLVTRHDEHGRVQYECLHCEYVGEGRSHTPRGDRHAAQLGERPVPLRLHVVDACRAVEVALCALADQVAAEVQHDGTDPARWRYNLGGRTAVRAAEWLLARLRDDAGPYLPLQDRHREQIAVVAREAARRIERTIGLDRDRRSVVMDGRPCPYCGGALTLHRGGGEPDTVTCERGTVGCSAPVPDVRGVRTWSSPTQLAALQSALDDAARRRKRAEDRARQRAAARARRNPAA
jgi:hypothetical protein